MANNGMPNKQGLYDPSYEHDNCGVGFLVNIKGKKSHDIVKNSLIALDRLEHRGATGCESNSGDGAGIMLQIPHEFFLKVCPEHNIELPEPGEYAVGMVYLPQNSWDRDAVEKIIERLIRKEYQSLLGWRTVPTNNEDLGKSATRHEPYMRQVFVKKNKNIKNSIEFERALYLIRRQAETEIRNSTISERSYFYMSSFSSNTIVYKGQLIGGTQVKNYYPDLSDEDFKSALAMVHSRFSTNTFPSWERAHPNRFIVHNGEINTIRGNVNYMKARESLMEDIEAWDEEDTEKLLPIIDDLGSDSARFDNTFEFFVLAGYSLEHALMMMIPEPWDKHKSMDPERKAFYQYHSCLMEPWDGPASIAVSDGKKICAVLDRNGLRPSRYYVTKDDMLVMASEVGVVDIEPDNIAYKGRLEPGRMFMVDTEKGEIIQDDELKKQVCSQRPYKEWIEKNILDVDTLEDKATKAAYDHDEAIVRMKAFGFSYELINTILAPMATDGKEASGAMGDDTPHAVLSDKPVLLYNYFRQLFAQVTNPPLDAIREEIVTSTTTYLGAEANPVHPSEANCHRIKFNTPIISDDAIAKIRNIKHPHFSSATLSILFNTADGRRGVRSAIKELYKQADEEIAKGTNILILSDRGFAKDRAGIPALLAASGLHQHLVKNGTRTRVGLVVESAEPREIHHLACLIGFGVDLVNPYLAFEALEDMIETNVIKDIDHQTAIKNYIKAATNGIVKVMSKVGISTIQSYRGAQIFEALGLSSNIIERYFTGTASRIEGAGLTVLSEEVIRRHNLAYAPRQAWRTTLETGGRFKWRADGERHLFSPSAITKLQYATRTGDYDIYKEYASIINDQDKKLCTLRGLFKFKFRSQSIPIDEVESVESIVKRFKTGAMSYGSISEETHESLAIAMNKLGGRSNTGEGGENPKRFTPDANGDSRRSAIKQVASGRFGVSSHYLVNADEIQIKMAQGAKPGEGGQLPGSKVYPWIAKTRGTTAGVGLISPPPHHDIYSIEDMAELIHDLKNANNQARICVKLVSEVGVGTIAAGVTKGKADVVLISGSDGGTGSSPLTSIKYAGLPWELGLAETHQTLMLNNLRSRITVETDGQLKTGRDVVIAALLGAEEFGFATAPMVVLGCVMMRVCHKNTCPVGVATQNPELRKRFNGNPDHVVNYFHFIAQEVREYMAKLGFRTIDEMIGRSDLINPDNASEHWKAAGLDISNILHRPDVSDEVGSYKQSEQYHGLDKSLDSRVLVELCQPAIKKGKPIEANLYINNTDRVVGTQVGAEISRKYGAEGLPEDTIKLKFEGHAGQSFGAFCPKGMSMRVEGDTNDYLGKGLSGAKLIVHPHRDSDLVSHKNIVTGNVTLYGATSGEAYISGIAGERFCVRNSGATAVVEGIGDHGCEYMTGGRVVVLGPCGRNFGAGMSGGYAYIYDEDGTFANETNTELIDLEKLIDEKDIEELKEIIQKHIKYTKSKIASEILENWEANQSKFIKVMPMAYKRMLKAFETVRAEGVPEKDVELVAFERFA